MQNQTVTLTPLSAPAQSRFFGWAFWTGFAGFFAVLYAAVRMAGPQGVFFGLMLDMPLLSMAMILFKRTRRFGLGILLASAIFIATAIATGGTIFE